MGSIRELGGFAKEEKDIDGTESEFNAFNYCLADSYVAAMIEEDFELLGEFSGCLLDEIIYWIDYDKKHDGEEMQRQLKDGSLITVKNRTFIDAIYEAKNGTLAETYINKGITSPKLALAVVLCEDEEYEPYVAYIGDSHFTKEDFDHFFKELYDLIEIEYDKAEDKNHFLQVLKDNYGRIRCYKGGNRIVPMVYRWTQALRDQEKEYVEKRI